MKFRHTKKGMSIKFSWKEKLIILFKGNLFFDAKFAYMFNTHLMRFISENISKTGNVTRHGQFQESEEVKSK